MSSTFVPDDALSDATAVTTAADRLVAAASSGVPCAPVRDAIGSDDLAAAYAVQQRVIAGRVAAGTRVVGRKIGLTSRAVQEQFDVNQPDFGVLLDDMKFLGGDTIPHGTVLQPRVEAEIAFKLRGDLVDGDLGLQQIRDAVEYAVAALEICGSRIADWDITIADTIADNASSGAFVIGPKRLGLDEFEPRDVSMKLEVDGEVVSTGQGTACLGDPLLAVQWLARTAREFGEPLRAGQIVLSGALGPIRPVGPGATISADITGLGKVTVDMGEENESHE